MNRIRLLVALLVLGSAFPAQAFFGLSSEAAEKECAQKNLEEWAGGGGECLRVITENAMVEPAALIVFIHGDVSKGGPSDYLAKRMGRVDPAQNQFVAVAIMRPGYEDSESNQSSGTDNRRRDHYTKHNVVAVAEAIDKLKAKYQPKATVIVGHSGGAAIAGVLAGMFPELAEHYVLGACPCDVVQWRKSRGRSVWRNSLSPSDYVGSVKKETEIVVVSGSEDNNTSAELSDGYVQLLKNLGVNASHRTLLGVSHNGVARNEAFFSSINELALGR